MPTHQLTNSKSTLLNLNLNEHFSGKPSPNLYNTHQVNFPPSYNPPLKANLGLLNLQSKTIN